MRKLAPTLSRHTRGRLRRIVATISIALGALAASIAVAPTAVASPSGDLAALTNSARAAAGLPALGVDGQLSAVAQAWANQLASRNALSHNPNLRVQVPNWSSLGENVGFSGDIPTVQKAFMNSPAHRANILNPKYTLMGVGSATSTYPTCGCTVIWVVVDFKRPETAAPAAPAVPAPAKHAAATQPKQTAPAETHKPAETRESVETHNPVVSSTTPTAPQRSSSATTTPSHSATPTSTATPASTTSPSASASASALNTQLATASSGDDPVSRVLTFASVVSRLPS